MEDADYMGQVKKLDQELVDTVRTPSSATDEDVQKKLDQLYIKNDLKEKKQNVQQQLLTEIHEEQNAVLAMKESNVMIDDQFKKRLMEAVKNDDQYDEMIQKLEDPDQPNEIQVNERVYRIKARTLKVHEEGQDKVAKYWRTVVPNDIDIKRMILHVPYYGHPGFTRTSKIVKQFFYWKHVSPDI